MYLTHALRAILRTAVATGDALWKYVSLLLSGTPPTQTFIADASVNANVLTLNGDVRPSNLNPYVEGYYSTYFDGNGDYTTTADNLAFLFGTENFTIEAWINTSATTQTYGKRIISHYTYAAADYGWFLEVLRTSSTTIKFLGATSNAVGISLSTSNTLTPNTWHHIVVSRSGSTASMFLDGVRVATQTGVTWNDINTITNGIELGSQANAGGTLYDGYMSNVRIVKGTAVYDPTLTTCTVPTAPLTAISGTTFLSCQSNRLIDNSILNTSISRFGDISVRGFVPFTPPTTVNVNTLYSTYFDGSGDTIQTPSITIGTNAFCFECWLYPTVTQGTTTGIFVGSTTNSLQASYYGNPGLGIATKGTAWQLYEETTLPTVNAWNHVAFVRSGTGTNQTSIYINGVRVANGTVTSSFEASVYQISTTNAGGSVFQGYISNARLVNGSTPYDASQSTITVPTAPLTAIANTSLLTCQNATLRDNSTNALAITSSGQAQPIDVSPFTQVTTPVTATYLGSGYFDGSGDYLFLPTSNVGNLSKFLTSNFTVECWVYPTSISGDRTIISAVLAWGAGANYNIEIRSGLLHIQIGNNVNLTNGSISISNNAWTHIALVRSGLTSTTVYVNGVSSATYTSTWTADEDCPLTIGCFNVNGGSLANYWQGYIADLRITNGAARYTANFAPPATPLTAVANTSLLTLQTDQPAANKQFVDNSGSNLVITQAGNATQGAFSPYGANWSNYFDGSSSYLTASSTVIPATQSTFTIEAWVYMTAGPNGTFIPGMCGDMLGGSNTNYMSFGPVTISGTRYVGFYWYDPSQRNCYGSTTPLSLNTWYHIAISISSNVIKMFVNGVSQTITYSAGVSGLTNRGGTSSNFTIGGFNAASNSYIGYISNLRVVNGSAVYPADFTPSITPLTPVANTALMTCQGPSLTDSSNAALALTRTGTVAVQRFSPFSPVIQAPVSYSTYFDGSGDYLSIATSTAFGFGTGDFTIEFWAYSTSTSRQDWVDISDGTNRVLFYYTGSAVTFYGNGVTAITGAALVTNAWVHYAVVKSSGSTKLYVNGTQAGSTYATNQNYGTTAAVSIGKDMFGSTYITGNLSNFRIVKGTAVYTSNFTPSTTPLTAISGTSLLTCQSPTIIDNSTNAFPITVSGNAIARSQNPFGFTNTTTDTAYTPALYGGSAYFDGTGDYLNTPSLISASGDFTLECWFNTTIAVSGYRMLCGGAIDTSASNYLAIYASGVEAQFGAGAATVTTAAYTFTPNTWYHVAMTRSGTTIRMFVNGVSLTTSQGSQAGTFAIRYIANGYAGLIYTGYMADLRFVIGQALYTGGFVPPIAPLQAVKNTVLLLNMDKSGITDSSRNIDLETVGDAKIRYESPYSGSYYSNYFDGTGDYLIVPNNTAFAFGSGNFTVEMWVSLSSASGTVVNYSNGQSTNSNFAWELYQLNSSTVMFSIFEGATQYISSSTAFALNQWNHIACVRNGNTLTTYVNGVAGGTTVNVAGVTISAPANASVNICSYLNGSYNPAGHISNFRIVKGTALYTANFAPPTAPLTAVSGTSLLTCQSKSFVDNSSNNFTITRNGDVAVRSYNPFQANIANSSMYFDGSGDSLKAPYNPSYSLPGDFTVESWVYLTSAGGTGNQTIASFGYLNSTGTGPWGFYLNGTGPYTLYFNSSAGNKFTSTTVAIPVGTWNHVTYCRSGSTGRFFVNGVMVGTTISDTFTYSGTTESLYVGTMGDGATAPFNGYLADFRITKSARYTANFTPPTAPLPTA